MKTTHYYSPETPSCPFLINSENSCHTLCHHCSYEQHVIQAQSDKQESSASALLVAGAIGLVLLFAAINDRPPQVQPTAIPASTTTQL